MLTLSAINYPLVRMHCGKNMCDILFITIIDLLIRQCFKRSNASALYQELHSLRWGHDLVVVPDISTLRVEFHFKIGATQFPQIFRSSAPEVGKTRKQTSDCFVQTMKQSQISDLIEIGNPPIALFLTYCASQPLVQLHQKYFCSTGF